jgi:hypothetical protein
VREIDREKVEGRERKADKEDGMNEEIYKRKRRTIRKLVTLL